MFGWLKRDEGFWRPKERLIYGYWNGRELVRADPMTLYKRYMDVRSDLLVDWKVARFEVPEVLRGNEAMTEKQRKTSQEADDKFLERVRGIFSVKPFHEGGLTEIELKALLDHFLAFCLGVKKNSSRTTTPAPVPSPTGGSFEAADESPTSNSSDSGSTANADSTARPEPSPTESASCSA